MDLFEPCLARNARGGVLVERAKVSTESELVLDRDIVVSHDDDANLAAEEGAEKE